MSDLDRLRVWDDSAVRGALSWYLDVAENRRPAKFRIAAAIATQPELTRRIRDAREHRKRVLGMRQERGRARRWQVDHDDLHKRALRSEGTCRVGLSNDRHAHPRSRAIEAPEADPSCPASHYSDSRTAGGDNDR